MILYLTIKKWIDIENRFFAWSWSSMGIISEILLDFLPFFYYFSLILGG